MLPSLGIAGLPSDVSPATLDISFSTLNLGLHCVELMPELVDQTAGPDPDPEMFSKQKTCSDGMLEAAG